ncbi:BTB/POZ domain-containing adapter for CUL3-mediated RhoA degradation protein 3-like isoform X1 [Portunus trituberculatus]|nr:BTB/POZ domain-containing adapter for CUL3-mediated RhoA degradation protein 3-like isoform X1 [Portunus trituberculatus]
MEERRGREGGREQSKGAKGGEEEATRWSPGSGGAASPPSSETPANIFGCVASRCGVVVAGVEEVTLESTRTVVVAPPSPTSEMSGDHKKVIKGSPSQYVKLNVGGSLHYTTIGTLTKHDNMLRAMFSGRMEVLTDSEGWILIDRCGKHFGTILNYLRDEWIPIPENQRELQELLAEARYYCMSDLVEVCEGAVRQREPEKDPVCRVPLITSQREEQMLIQSTSKPVVKLLVNRHNNKYSYTSTSDDNLLKNIELFDRLSLRFSRRVLFIKDVIGSNEICLWAFYGHGKKLAEVCCTSIVYATDRKHTKVEFPEARIYEETLNVLLYENRTGPDAELMQATSTRGAVAPVVCTSDDEEERRGGACSQSGLGRLRSNKNN